MLLPSLLASAQGRADWSVTGRLDEHGSSGKTMGLVCALGEQDDQRPLPRLHQEECP